MAKKKEATVEKVPDSVVVINSTVIKQEPDEFSPTIFDADPGMVLKIGSKKNTKDYLCVKMSSRLFGNEIVGYIRKDCVSI